MALPSTRLVAFCRFQNVDQEVRAACLQAFTAVTASLAAAPAEEDGDSLERTFLQPVLVHQLLSASHGCRCRRTHYCLLSSREQHSGAVVVFVADRVCRVPASSRYHSKHTIIP